jgi:flavin-dependent dehydrogenase
MGETAPPPLTFDFTVPGGYGWLFPRNDHVNVGLYVYDAGGAHTLNRAALAEYIAARCGGREFYGLTGQYLGFGAESEAAATGRVLLAGDAGGFADPLTGEGIYGAIRSGQAAAAAVLKALQQGTGAATAADAYRRATAPLRRDLRVATDTAKSFYRAPARAFSLLRYAPVRAAAIQTFTYGSSITRLAFGVRALARIVPMPAAPQAERKKLPHSRQSA